MQRRDDAPIESSRRPMITALIVEDLPAVRQHLRELIQAEADLALVGAAADSLEALRLVEQLHPTVMVADLILPGMGGFELTRAVCQRHPQTGVVIRSIQASPRYLRAAFACGARGYVVNTAPALDLLTAVRHVAAGARYISPPLTERDLEMTAATTVEPAHPSECLTAREREVLALAAEGHTNAEMGAHLGISPRTVEVHRANLMRKVGLRSQTDLVRYALRRGILPPD